MASGPSGATQDRAQFLKMTTEPVGRLIGKLAVPTIISMLVTSIYNMADTFFVSQLGTSATGAVGVVFSLMAIIQAVGFTLGMGSGSNISRLLGQEKKDEADRVASTAFFTALLLGLCITVIGLLSMKNLMRLLGATETILPYAQDYARYILFGAPIMCASFVMNNDLRSEGKAVLSMMGIATGGVLNIALDPLFIFVFDMGISGAAIATLLSQCISFCILLSNYLFRRSTVRIAIRKVSLRWGLYQKIVVTGMPSFFRQALASFASISLNVAARAYGDPAVAAMSVVGRVFMFILSAMLGFGQGFQPVCGYNYGAGRYDRVKRAYLFCLKVGFCGLLVLSAAGFALAPKIMAIFRRDDPVVIAIGALAFRLQCCSLPLHSFIVISNMLFQSLGKARQATFISVARQGLFFLPLIYTLPSLIGVLGVQCSQPIADLVTALACVPIVLLFFRQLNAQIAAMPREGTASPQGEPAPQVQKAD